MRVLVPQEMFLVEFALSCSSHFRCFDHFNWLSSYYVLVLVKKKETNKQTHISLLLRILYRVFATENMKLSALDQPFSKEICLFFSMRPTEKVNHPVESLSSE